MSTGFQLLLTLHLLCVIGGFGYLAYSGVTLVVGRRRGAAIGTLEVTLQVGVLAELLIYGAVVFGIAAVGSSGRWTFQQTWVWSALILYVVAIGILHGLIKRSQREYASLARQLSEVGPVRQRPPEIDRIESLEQRIAVGWGVFNLLVVAVVCLMVWKPGA